MAEESVSKICVEILSQISTHGVLLEGITQQVGELRNEIEGIKKEVTQVSFRIVEIDNKAEGAQDKASDAQQKINDLQTDIKKLEERADNLHTAVVKARAQVPNDLVAGFAVLQSDMKRINRMNWLIASSVVVLIIKAVLPMVGG
jgi:predicted  nucleic acid-binding Zn-ribbon protein